MRWLLVGVPAAGIATMAARILYAENRGRLVAGGYAMKVGLEAAVVFPLAAHWGAAGVCVASSAGYWLLAGVFLVARPESVRTDDLIPETLRLIGVCAVGGGTAWLACVLMGSHLLALALGLAAGACAALAAGRLLGSRVTRNLWRLALRPAAQPLVAGARLGGGGGT